MELLCKLRQEPEANKAGSADSFLSLLTVTPLRLLMVLPNRVRNFRTVGPSDWCDLCCLIILIAGVKALQQAEIRYIYHSIRFEPNIKLYVIYNMLEFFILDFYTLVHSFIIMFEGITLAAALHHAATNRSLFMLLMSTTTTFQDTTTKSPSLELIVGSSSKQQMINETSTVIPQRDLLPPASLQQLPDRECDWMLSLSVSIQSSVRLRVSKVTLPAVVDGVELLATS
ncbi:hypothetical protein SELMODRAFT_419649 [Selaginella moellendorffii]|uniref:Uncharacterized protein n=1 Tax=Selaginella moellendorffii TaxID=88036 RepID=D8S9L2_SELML|nr:hypothetical protein SELMODRAFT_419649 [Selaginella moellendorffii]